MVSYGGMAATAPVRIVGSALIATCNGTVHVDQFNARYVATARDLETAIVATLCTKTYCRAFQFEPGIYDLNGTENEWINVIDEKNI